MTVQATILEDWQVAWRYGFVPVLPLAGLNRLREALVNDLDTLVQGRTTVPMAMPTLKDWPIEAACAIGVCGWGDEFTTVNAACDFFYRTVKSAEDRLHSLGYSTGISRHFLRWFDTTPRDKMRWLLLPEVEEAIKLKEAQP